MFTFESHSISAGSFPMLYLCSGCTTKSGQKRSNIRKQDSECSRKLYYNWTQSMKSTPRWGHYPKLTAVIENCSSKTTQHKAYVQHANRYTKSNETKRDKHWPTEYKNRDRTTNYTSVYTRNKNKNVREITTKERSAVKRQCGVGLRGRAFPCPSTWT